MNTSFRQWMLGQMSLMDLATEEARLVDKKEGDVVLGVVKDDYIRRLFCLWITLQRMIRDLEADGLQEMAEEYRETGFEQDDELPNQGVGAGDSCQKVLQLVELSGQMETVGSMLMSEIRFGLDDKVRLDLATIYIDRTFRVRKGWEIVVTPASRKKASSSGECGNPETVHEVGIHMFRYMLGLGFPKR